MAGPIGSPGFCERGAEGRGGGHGDLPGDHHAVDDHRPGGGLRKTAVVFNGPGPRQTKSPGSAVRMPEQAQGRAGAG